MASTMLSDLIIPAVWEDYGYNPNPISVALEQSGILYSSPMLDTLNAGPSAIFNMPFWNDISLTTEPNYGTDNPADVAVPEKITAGNSLARRAIVNKGYGTADLDAMITGADPVLAIKTGVERMWSVAKQARLIATMTGIYNANVAGTAQAFGTAGDMIYSIAAPAGVTPNATTTPQYYFNRSSFIGSIFTAGDQFANFTAIAMHSTVFATMNNQQLINFVQPANVPILIPYYDGKLVIVSDQMPIIPATGTGGTLVAAQYVSYLFGSQSIGYSDQPGVVPVENYRRPDEGNGNGVDQWWFRRKWIMHPKGYSFTSATVSTEITPNLADLQLATNWARFTYRKNVPLAFMVTNG